MWAWPPVCQPPLTNPVTVHHQRAINPKAASARPAESGNYRLQSECCDRYGDATQETSLRRGLPHRRIADHSTDWLVRWEYKVSIIRLLCKCQREGRLQTNHSCDRLAYVTAMIYIN